MDVLEALKRAADEFDRRVQSVSDDEWTNSTPCSEWDVRALVNHIVNECVWISPLLEGKTIEEVGDRFDGDLLGDDPKSAWKDASRQAVEAASRPGAMERTVHLSFGDFSGSKYLADVASDIAIHTWDLACGIGANKTLDPSLVEFAHSNLEPQVEAWRAAGVFAAPLEPNPQADQQERLLGMVGRDATPG